MCLWANKVKKQTSGNLFYFVICIMFITKGYDKQLSNPLLLLFFRIELLLIDKAVNWKGLWSNDNPDTIL